MSQADLGNVRVLVAEKGQLRRQIRTVLTGNGFGEVEQATSSKAVREAIELNLVDMLIADYDLDPDICGVVRDLRHFKLGTNPFIVVVMLAGGTDVAVIREIIDAGADDLLVKPITIGALTERVLSLTQNRKKFVVTSDYIGPTRKADTNAGEDGPAQVEVPNPVKDRAEGIKSTDMEGAIVEATKLINQRKLERDALQVVWLTERLMPHYAENDPGKEVMPLVDELVAVANDIGRRLKGTQFDHVGELCASLRNVAKGIQRRPKSPSSRDLKLLPELASAVKMALAGNADEVDVARNIASTVSGSA